MGIRHVKVLSCYDQPIDLEQCEKCGGILLDESELYRARQGEAEKIEAMSDKCLHNPSITSNEVLTCPETRTYWRGSQTDTFPRR